MRRLCILVFALALGCHAGNQNARFRESIQREMNSLMGMPQEQIASLYGEPREVQPIHGPIRTLGGRTVEVDEAWIYYGSVNVDRTVSHTVPVPQNNVNVNVQTRPTNTADAISQNWQNSHPYTPPQVVYDTRTEAHPFRRIFYMKDGVVAYWLVKPQ